jgi:ferredoxin
MSTAKPTTPRSGLTRAAAAGPARPLRELVPLIQQALTRGQEARRGPGEEHPMSKESIAPPDAAPETWPRVRQRIGRAKRLVGKRVRDAEVRPDPWLEDQGTTPEGEAARCDCGHWFLCRVVCPFGAYVNPLLGPTPAGQSILRRRRCRVCATARVRAQAQRNLARRTRRRAAARQGLTCQSCGLPLTAARRRRRFCGATCRQRAHRLSR